MTTQPIAYVRDDFADNVIAATWATYPYAQGSASRSESGGQAVITLPSSTAGTHENGYYSAGTYDLTGDSCFWTVGTMVSTAVAATAWVGFFLDAANQLRWQQLSGTLKAQKVVAGVTTDLFSVAWNSSTHKYLRIRESGGNILFDTSSNGTSWTNRHTTSGLPIAVTALHVFFAANCGNVASPGSLRLDEINLILPALSTNWHSTTVEWPYLERFRVITIAASGGQGYIATSNDGATWQYFAGPMGSGSGGYNQLTSQPSQAQAQAMAVNLPLDGRWDLNGTVECRFIRLFHRSITGSSYILREYYPRRLVQSDDMEAETIRAINIGAHEVTADKIFVLDLSAITASIGQLTITNSTGAPAWLYQGTGTGDSPTTGLKIFNSGGIGKLSTYNATVEQITLDTDGRLKAGAGLVVLDANGVTIETPASASYNVLSAIEWHNTVNNADVGRIYGWYNNVQDFNHIAIEALRSGTTRPGMVELFANGWNTLSSQATIDMFGGTAAQESYIDLTAQHIDVDGVLNAEDGINLPRSGGSAVFAVDTTTQGSAISLANNATATPFGNANNFAGLILINETSTFGSPALFLTGGGAMVEIADPGVKYSTTSGTASMINVYLVSGVVTIENKTGSTISLNVCGFRNRAGN